MYNYKYKKNFSTVAIQFIKTEFVISVGTAQLLHLKAPNFYSTSLPFSFGFYAGFCPHPFTSARWSAIALSIEGNLFCRQANFKVGKYVAGQSLSKANISERMCALHVHLTDRDLFCSHF